jgi:hypothetical protein
VARLQHKLKIDGKEEVLVFSKGKTTRGMTQEGKGKVIKELHELWSERVDNPWGEKAQRCRRKPRGGGDEGDGH